MADTKKEKNRNVGVCEKIFSYTNDQKQQWLIIKWPKHNFLCWEYIFERNNQQLKWALLKWPKQKLFSGWEYFLGGTVKQMFNNQNGCN
jgi:hypothetical protein